MVWICRSSVPFLVVLVEVLTRRPAGAKRVRCGIGSAGMVIISGRTIPGDCDRAIASAVSAFTVLGVMFESSTSATASRRCISAFSCASSAWRLLREACFSLMLSGMFSSSSCALGCSTSLSGASSGRFCCSVEAGSVVCVISSWTCSRSFEGLLVASRLPLCLLRLLPLFDLDPRGLLLLDIRPLGRSAGGSSPNCTGVGGSSGSLLACLIELLEDSGLGTSFGRMKEGVAFFVEEGDPRSLCGRFEADGCLDVRGDLTEVDVLGLFSVKARAMAAEKPSFSCVAIAGA